MFCSGLYHRTIPSTNGTFNPFWLFFFSLNPFRFYRRFIVLCHVNSYYFQQIICDFNLPTHIQHIPMLKTAISWAPLKWETEADVEGPLYIYSCVFSKTAATEVLYRGPVENWTIQVKINLQTNPDGSFSFRFPSPEPLLLSSRFAACFPSAFCICCTWICCILQDPIVLMG